MGLDHCPHRRFEYIGTKARVGHGCGPLADAVLANLACTNPRSSEVWWKELCLPNGMGYGVVDGLVVTQGKQGEALGELITCLRLRDEWSWY